MLKSLICLGITLINILSVLCCTSICLTMERERERKRVKRERETEGRKEGCRQRDEEIQ